MFAQRCERAAHRRLAHVEAPTSARHVPLPEQRFEHDQKIEVQRQGIHGRHTSHATASSAGRYKALYRKVLALVEPHLRSGSYLVTDDADACPDYVAHVRQPGSGYMSMAFDDDVELTVKL